MSDSFLIRSRSAVARVTAKAFWSAAGDGSRTVSPIGSRRARSLVTLSSRLPLASPAFLFTYSSRVPTYSGTRSMPLSAPPFSSAGM
jgi:hypothetical protein